MSLKAHFELAAQYNRWMNNKLFDAAMQLDEQQLQVDKGAFFASISGTLNHIMVADMIWLKRFSQHQTPFRSLTNIRNSDVPNSLNHLLFRDINPLNQARINLDKVIIELVDELKDADIESTLAYPNRKGQLFNKKFGLLLQHFFNHQTHHRGQVTTLLSQSGVDAGITDLLAIIPDA